MVRCKLGWEEMINGYGISSEWEYPFLSFDGSSHQCMSTPPNGIVNPLSVTGYKHVQNTTEALMDAVANVGPIAIGVAAEPWDTYESGVFTGCSYPLEIDHAVVLEGYGTDSESGLDYWLVRNSWSPQWGENGYIRIVRPAQNPCGTVENNQQGLGCANSPTTVQACGTCGINIDAAYPTV